MRKEAENADYPWTASGSSWKEAWHEHQWISVSKLFRTIQEKRAAGFIYESEEWKLKHFDAFCIEESVTAPRLSRELVMSLLQSKGHKDRLIYMAEVGMNHGSTVHRRI